MHKIKDTSTSPLQPDACILDCACSDTCVNWNIVSETPKKLNSLRSICYASNEATSKTSHPQSNVALSWFYIVAIVLNVATPSVA